MGQIRWFRLIIKVIPAKVRTKETRDGVLYDGNETENGQIQIRDQVPVMEGVGTAVEGKFAPMLVPWTVLAPATDRGQSRHRQH